MGRKLETEGYVYVSGTVIHVSQLAILFDDGKRREWVPLSQIEDPEHPVAKNEKIELLIPDWLAKEKGFV